jgi:hypothetical protein
MKQEHLCQDAVDPFGMRDAFDTLCIEADNLIQKHKTMEQTKIQNLTPQGSFESNGKTFYKFDCILENGQIGEVNALSPDKWSVGDEVVVKEHQATKWGPRLKLDKPGFSGGFTGKSGGNDDTTKGIIASWAVGCAMASAGAYDDSYDQRVLHLARIALQARDLIKKEVQP